MKSLQYTLNPVLDLKTSDTLIVPAFMAGDQPEIIEKLGLTETLKTLLDNLDFKGEVGETLSLLQTDRLNVARILFVGFGKHRDFNTPNYLKALKKAASALDHTGAKAAFNTLNSVFPEDQAADWALYQNALIFQHSFYQYKHESQGKKPRCRDPKLDAMTFYAPDTAIHQAKLQQAQATAHGMALTQELANMPANFCTPLYLAETAATLAELYGFEVVVLEREDAEELGMGAFLAVAQGTETPPKFITLSYQGADESEAPIALVGKGVTFDTGGISLKPGAAMDEMKYDMAGAASVLGIFKALGELKPNINVVGIIPATENMPDGKAIKPGDVVRSLSGQTIEILNTDAEGRLVLCDALTYAQQTFKPAQIIDMATLTGACIIALGHHISGLMGNDESLIENLLEAGNYTYDRLWQLPLSPEYDEQLKSNFADMANIGGRSAGTITAAQFLQRFIKNVPWAHCDIAGTAWVSGENKGATGRPVPALVEFLTQQALQD